MKSSGTPDNPAYLDTSLPFDERVRDLVGRLTLDEKVGLMSHPAQGIPRLGIPAYNYWSEALARCCPQWACHRLSPGDRHGCHLG